MFFVLQKENGTELELDLIVLQRILKKQRILHEYTFMSLEEISTAEFLNSKAAIPVGTIEFVQGYLRNIHNIDKMNPIEVPKELRQPEYLHREYQVVKAKDLPKQGNWFIKDASRLKGFSYSGNIQNLEIILDGNTGMDEKFRVHADEEQDMIVSSVMYILSEYRVFVIDNKIEAIQYYDGEPTIMPSPADIQQLKEMVQKYAKSPDCPKAYTMDIAIIDKDQKCELAIIECHPFTSVGLYGFSGDMLPYAYRYGIDWYLHCNRSLTQGR